MKSASAVVTGASHGIGRAVADKLMEDGYRVFNLDREQPEVKGHNDNIWVDIDLVDIEKTRAALDAVLSRGPVSVLVNNAAIGGDMSLLEETSANDIDRVHAINVRAPAMCARHLTPTMREQRFGRIINISSRAHLGKAYRTAYGGSKGALVSMTRVWAIELAEYGITCNAIAPGPIRTELFERSNPPGMARTQRIIDEIPVGRLGEPADIAHTVGYLAAKAAGYVTGQVIYVCGGTTLTRGGS